MSSQTPVALPKDNREKLLERAMSRHQYSGDALIEVMHTAQELFGFLSPSLLINIAHKLKLPPSRVLGVASFYHFFTLKPKGEHTFVVCLGTACYVAGALGLVEKLERRCARAGQTTPDGRVSVDDWAWRKRQEYGTILMDLEQRQVIDLLPVRSAASFADWLRHHPGVEIIARDRCGLYAEGGHEGAPSAVQMAQIAHLCENLR